MDKLAELISFVGGVLKTTDGEIHTKKSEYWLVRDRFGSINDYLN
jgi:hypothetical protein